MLTIANGQQLGYGFKIASTAQLDDSLFDVTLIEPFPLLSGINLVFWAFKGRLHNSRFVSHIPGKTITIYHPDLNYFQVDEELR